MYRQIQLLVDSQYFTSYYKFPDMYHLAFADVKRIFHIF
jgi:hypothetical protein